MRKRVTAGAGRLEFIPPMMPTLVAKPPHGDGWTHEVKIRRLPLSNPHRQRGGSHLHQAGS
ncbi:hypothetical protein MES5069_270215 [Mesorhizobium escarrei]|uniref:Uncharacterized protein n=1 Tax=Mesorhizobium escarrei TaxID=666018 RepID=A0ABM9DWC0_9HYPH|nr:hypothetical protein MES5069_270215 [Mesorhizobium escarrei]